MPETGFPSLNATPDDDCYAIDQLGTHPDRWGEMSIPELQHLVAFYSMGWVWNNCSEEMTQPLRSLHALFTERVPEEDRLETLKMVGLYAERAARDDDLRQAGMACAWFLTDPSPLVVSTAALSLASLMPATEDDGMAGPRFVIRWADRCGNGERRAAMLAGLVAIGNPQVMDVVGDCWQSLDSTGRDVLARLGPGQFASSWTVDFFLRWAESAVGAADEAAEGLVPAMGGLLTLARRAAAIGPNGEPLGVAETDRAFPVWSRPAESVAIVRRRWTREGYGAVIGPRLVGIAVAAAVASQAVGDAPLAVFDPPVEVEVHPDVWQPDQLVEWGILNPNGPTKCQIAVVGLGSGSSALVWTLHHFLVPKCLVLAAGQLDDPGVLREALARVFEANCGAEHQLIHALPHWVRLLDGCPLDAGAMARLFGAAHRRYLVNEEMRGVPPDEILAQLRGLAVDPVAEIGEQEREAFKELGPLFYAVKNEDWETFRVFQAEIRKRETLAELPGDDFYGEWMRLAADPAHVELVGSHFDSAEREARRRYQQAWAQPQPDGANPG